MAAISSQVTFLAVLGSSGAAAIAGPDNSRRDNRATLRMSIPSSLCVHGLVSVPRLFGQFYLLTAHFDRTLSVRRDTIGSGLSTLPFLSDQLDKHPSHRNISSSSQLCCPWRQS